MDKSLLHKLQRLTGSLTASRSTPPGELARLQRTLAAHPDFTVTGNRLPGEGAEAAELDPASETTLAERIRDLVTPPGETSDGSAQLFRRETAFRSSLLGISVPEWGAGRAPAASFGPFTDERGLSVWYDLFFATRFVSVMFGATTLLRVPIRGLLASRQSYRIEAGSLWVASQLLANVAALNGCFTGLRIAGGTLEFSAAPIVASGQLVISAATRMVLDVQLDPPTPPNTSNEAGVDAAAARVDMPKSVRLSWQAGATAVTAVPAGCEIFGCSVDLQPTGAAPTWLPQLDHILVPYVARTDENQADHFSVHASKSDLCTLDESAPVDSTRLGWLLPKVKADPLTLGDAAGVGSLCIGLGKGLTARWQGLKGPATRLTRPALIVEPGLLSILDFEASNVSARLRWQLWRNERTDHWSEVVLTYGKTFPFVFISSTANSETVLFFCAHTAAVDRPVEANGKPFPIRSPLALAGIFQTAAAFRATLVDTDLLMPEDAFTAYSIALRNALFTVGAPRSLTLVGDLEDGRIVKGLFTLTHDIHQYLPTLPDPYVASYTPYLRDRAALAAGRPQQSLTGFVKWPNTSPQPADRPDEDFRSLVYYKLTPLLPPAPTQTTAVSPTTGKSFLTGASTFNQNLLVRASNETVFPLTQELPTRSARPTATNASARALEAARSGELRTVISDLDRNPLLSHIENKTEQVARVLESASGTTAAAIDRGAPQREQLPLGQSLLRLLDVSSHADQMGVSLGPQLRVSRDSQGDFAIRTEGPATTTLAVSGDSGMPLQIMNMDVVIPATHVRATTLPQISWEPVWNVPLKLEGSTLPAYDTVTYAPGLVLHENDGYPTIFASVSPYFVPIAPLPVTRHFIKEFNDEQTPREIHSLFTLPFGMVAQTQFNRAVTNPAGKNAQLDLHMPHFNTLRGGLQIRATPPESAAPATRSPSFAGATVQLDNIRWWLTGVPLTGSALGDTVRGVFNQHFSDPVQREVPLERIDFSGYGASIFSDWRNADASVADVSQARFDVVAGRTAHEVVQIRTFCYPFGAHFVRTITFLRSNNGYVFRSDSGWKAESDGFYDFRYKLSATLPGPHDMPNPYEFHPGAVKGISRIREIRDFPEAGKFTSHFDRAEVPITDAQWSALFGTKPGLDVTMQAVLFDADVHVDDIVSGGSKAGTGTVVQTRRMLGYVQLAPNSVLVPPRILAQLLASQNGSVGGPVDCTIDIGKSGQRLRVSRVDVSPATDAGGKPIFASAARGSLILPKDGAWSVVKQHTDTGDVKTVPVQEGVSLIRRNGTADFLISPPADVVVPASKTRFGVVQSTGTQKLLFDVPTFTPGVPKFKSAQAYFADAYKLLNSKGPFPNIVNALGLTNAEREVEILGEGVMRLAERTLNLPTLLPPNYTYPFIDEPGVLRIYAEYHSSGDPSDGALALGFDSNQADLEKRWKSALSNMRVVVDLGPFPEIMWIDGHFNAGSGVSTAFDKPRLRFGPVLDPIVQMLQILSQLSGGDFDRGMSVGMSNSADNWEYKFDCSKEIPVIKFPSPLQLTINPNPPLKLEAGLKVGVYFNQVLSVPTDLKQLVPACGAYVEFYGRLQVQCFTLAVASVYGVGQANLGIAADTKAGVTVHMKFGFGAEVVVGLPVVANVSVLYMVEVEASINDTALDVAGLLLFRGSAEILGGLVAIAIQIEAGGAVHHDSSRTSLVAQVTFSIDICVLWVIDIEDSWHWEEQRQIA